MLEFSILELAAGDRLISCPLSHTCHREQGSVHPWLLSTGEVQPPGVPSATVKRPELLADVFFVNKTKVRAIIGLGVAAHCSCLGLWFEAHNAR